VWLYRELLRAIGQETLTVGTLGAFLGDEQIATNHTTPDPDVLFPLLARAVKAGIKSCAMEVSSHSLVQEKIGPIQYAAAAFTSFSRDHLDFHRHMNDYFAAKWRLFTEFLLPGAAGFIHTSVDPSLLPATLPARLAFYGKLPAPYGIDVIKRDLAGSRVALRDGKAVHEGDLPFFADHAAANWRRGSSLSNRKMWRCRPLHGGSCGLCRDGLNRSQHPRANRSCLSIMIRASRPRDNDPELP
jgi:UDP-N-acetylmuramoyl-L-alanyl-D-glutamate--2,6-diaminopimelate ligase